MKTIISDIPSLSCLLGRNRYNHIGVQKQELLAHSLGSILSQSRCTCLLHCHAVMGFDVKSPEACGLKGRLQRLDRDADDWSGRRIKTA